MTKLPNKLIVVGMRYTDPKHQRAFNTEYARKKAGKLLVTLSLEGNESGVRDLDGRVKAYAVYCNLPETGSIKLGYIRNKDLPALSFHRPTVTGYVVTGVQANYLVLTQEAQDSVDDLRLVSGNNPCKATLYEYGDFNYLGNTQTTNTSNISKQPKETKMNTASLKDSFFREVKNVVIDIQSGKLGVTSKDGIATFADNQVSVNPIVDFGIKIPAFAMRVEVTNLAEGDIIISGDESTFFKSKTENGYEVVTLSGEVRQVGSVSNMFFGKNTVLAVKNMFGEGTNPMMMAMLMGDGFGSGDKGDNKNMMLMMMAMSGGMGGAADNTGMGGMNPMMLAMLMSK
jgi:hypothetical protein